MKKWWVQKKSDENCGRIPPVAVFQEVLQREASKPSIFNLLTTHFFTLEAPSPAVPELLTYIKTFSRTSTSSAVSTLQRISWKLNQTKMRIPRPKKSSLTNAKNFAPINEEEEEEEEVDYVPVKREFGCHD